jgi:hypothetical protein
MWDIGDVARAAQARLLAEGKTTESGLHEPVIVGGGNVRMEIAGAHEAEVGESASADKARDTEEASGVGVGVDSDLSVRKVGGAEDLGGRAQTRRGVDAAEVGSAKDLGSEQNRNFCLFGRAVLVDGQDRKDGGATDRDAREGPRLGLVGVGLGEAGHRPEYTLGLGGVGEAAADVGAEKVEEAVVEARVLPQLAHARVELPELGGCAARRGRVEEGLAVVEPAEHAREVEAPLAWGLEECAADLGAHLSEMAEDMELGVGEQGDVAGQERGGLDVRLVGDIPQDTRPDIGRNA